MIYKLKNFLRNASHKNKLLKKIYSLLNIVKVRSLSFFSDEKFAKLKYRENTGKKINLDCPTTFNEKLWWLKLYNRDPLLTICSDKYKVREYVISKGLEHILVPIYKVYDRVTQINFNELPERVFIKMNNGSGTNIIWDKNKPISKKRFIKKFNNAFRSNYFWQSREWNYKNIVPKIIAEKVLEDKNNISLIDYRFLCFDGKVKMIFVDIETAAEDGTHNPYAKRNVYDRNFNYLNIKVKRDNFDVSLISKPYNFNQMITYAETLSKDFVFCRVDLYNVEGKIYFGEITFYPGGATQLFEPYEWEIELGKWIDLKSSLIITE